MFDRLKSALRSVWENKYKKLALFVFLLIVLSVAFVLLENYITKPKIDYSKPYVKIEKNYEIYEIHQPGGPYQYFIFDNEHRLLDYGYTTRIGPRITITHGLIKLHISLGTAFSLCRYYDPQKRLISDWFQNPLNESKTEVVYVDIPVDKWRLVVQDIFDKSKYFRTFERDFSGAVYPVTQADFINGGKQLRITYEAGKDKHEVTETLDLYNTGGMP